MLSEISARRSLLEPSFRYLSPGREGEKCRPLDHLGHIPFVHSARKLHGSNFLYIQRHSSYFLHVVRSSTSYNRAYLTIAHAFLQKHSYLWFRAIISLVFFHMVRAGAYWHKIHDIHACAFAVQTKESFASFGFLLRQLLWRHCKTFCFNINAEKPKFYSSTIV